jgi:lysophospholipase L1-like esterase
MRRLRRWLAALAPALATLVLLPLAAELTARSLLDVPRAHLVWQPNPSDCLRRSRLLGLEYAPRCNGASLMRDRTRYRTNEIGLRSDPIRDDGSLRILTLGDSCTFGWGVRQSAAYPQALQSLLDARSGPQRYQVINAGAPGYSSYEGLLFLRERGLALDPRVVIFAFGFNDFYPGRDIEERLRWNRRLFHVRGFLTFLSQESSFYRWFLGRREKLIESRDSRRVPLAKYERNLRAIVEASRGAGAKPLMVVFPYPDPAFHPYQQMAIGLAEALEVPQLRYEGPLLDFIHPTEAGYARLAAEILARLEAHAFL